MPHLIGTAVVGGAPRDVIAPPTDAEGGLFSEINDNSVAILLIYGTARILLAGDAATLAQAKEAEMVAHADDLLEQVRDLQVRTFAILEAAEASEQHRTALSAIREARGNLELLAKLLGELDDRPTVNVLISPEWLELRTVIVGALEPYTDARGAVLRAIEGAGNGSA